MTGANNQEFFLCWCRCNAKFLWKRISNEEKTAFPLLGQIWEVGQKLWLKEHNSVFSLLRNTSWPPSIEPYMTCLEENLRQKSIQLIGIILQEHPERNYQWKWYVFIIFRESLSVHNFNHLHWIGWLCWLSRECGKIAREATGRARLDVWFRFQINHT